MKRITTALLGAALVMSVCALTNITVTVLIPEAKYTNMVTVATNQGVTVDALLTGVVSGYIETQRTGLLFELWSKATPEQQQRALDVLSGVTP